MKHIILETRELDEPDGCYRGVGLVIKLFGFAIALAFGRRK